MKPITLARKVLRTPIKQLPGKVWRFLQHRQVTMKSRIHDRFISPYLPMQRYNLTFVALTSAGQNKPLHLSTEENKRLTEACRLWRAQQLPVLGAVCMDAGFAASVDGFAGHKYDADAALAFDLKPAARDQNRLRSRISGPYKRIDWHRDRRSGWRWSPALRGIDIVYGEPVGSDVKIPWELSRLQYLPGMAILAHDHYHRNRRDEAATLIRDSKNQLFDFLAENPPGFGVNWACPMDIALRLVSMVIWFDLVRPIPEAFTEEEDGEILTRLADHAHWVATRPEWNDHVRGNHFLVNCMGLVFAGAAVRGHPHSDVWFGWGAGNLLLEITDQFHKDGGNIEGSLYYHRLSLEAAMTAMRVIDANKALITGLDISARQKIARIPGGVRLSAIFDAPDKAMEAAHDRIQTAIEFSRNMLAQNGSAPQFGDNDGGRSLPLIPDEQGCFDAPDNWVRHLNFIEHAQDFLPIEAQWLNSIAPAKRLREAKQALETLDGSANFVDFGIWRRTRQGPDLWIKASKTGQHDNGGHDQCNCLALELHWRASPLIIQPGTGCYTPVPEIRNAFRQASSHNGPVSEAVPNHQFLEGPENLFKMHQSATVRIQAGIDDLTGVIEGRDGQLTRHITIDDQAAKIRDTVTSGTNRGAPISVTFLMPMTWTVVRKTASAQGYQSSFLLTQGHIRLIFSATTTIEGPELADYSPTYGQIAQCQRFRMQADGAIDWCITEIIDD